MPLAAISRRVMVPEPVFVTKANLLSGVISTQHGATWVVVEQGQDSGRGVELIDADRPVERGAGDDAVGHRQGPPRRVEGDLCRHGCGAAGERERLKGACDRRQLSVGSGPVALDRPGSRVGAVDVERPVGSEVALVEHVDDVAVAVDADRQVARGHRAHELEAAAGQHAKRAQRVAAGVDGEHEVPAVGELDAARGVEDLEGEGRGGVVPDAARRGARRLRQRPVRGTREHDDLVARDGVGLRIHRTGQGGRGLCRPQQAERDDGEQGEE